MKKAENNWMEAETKCKTNTLSFEKTTKDLALTLKEAHTAVNEANSSLRLHFTHKMTER